MGDPHGRFLSDGQIPLWNILATEDGPSSFFKANEFLTLQCVSHAMFLITRKKVVNWWGVMWKWYPCWQTPQHLGRPNSAPTSVLCGAVEPAASTPPDYLDWGSALGEMGFANRVDCHQQWSSCNRVENVSHSRTSHTKPHPTAHEQKQAREW